jgi:hypothetical protein
MLTDNFEVNSAHVKKENGHLISEYIYRNTEARVGENGKVTIIPKETKYTFKVDTKVPRMGLVSGKNWLILPLFKMYDCWFGRK